MQEDEYVMRHIIYVHSYHIPIKSEQGIQGLLEGRQGLTAIFHHCINLVLFYSLRRREGKDSEPCTFVHLLSLLCGDREVPTQNICTVRSHLQLPALTAITCTVLGEWMGLSPAYCQFFDCSLELIKIKVEVRLSLVQDVIWLLPQGGHSQIEPVVEGLNPFNV